MLFEYEDSCLLSNLENSLSLTLQTLPLCYFLFFLLELQVGRVRGFHAFSPTLLTDFDTFLISSSLFASFVMSSG